MEAFAHAYRLTHLQENACLHAKSHAIRNIQSERSLVPLPLRTFSKPCGCAARPVLRLLPKQSRSYRATNHFQREKSESTVKSCDPRHTFISGMARYSILRNQVKPWMGLAADFSSTTTSSHFHGYSSYSALTLRRPFKLGTDIGRLLSQDIHPPSVFSGHF